MDNKNINIGDSVICIGEKCNDCGWRKDLVFVVTSIVESSIKPHMNNIAFGGHCGNGVFFKNLKKYEPNCLEFNKEQLKLSYLFKARQR